MSKKANKILIIVDPENDFVVSSQKFLKLDKNFQLNDVKTINDFNKLFVSENLIERKGTLCVNADEAIDNIVKLIDVEGKKFKAIKVTVDMHHLLQIFHSLYWINSKGEHPKPFTVISVEDVEKGIWRTTHPSFQKWGLEYVKKLKAQGKFELCIWPPHCLIGTWGNCIEEKIMNKLLEWCEKYAATIDFTPKGSNPDTEQYSAMKAEVVVNSDKTTMLNMEFIEPLKDPDVEIVCTGFASSHCYKETLEDIFKELGPDQIKKFVILSDCTAPVNGFEQVEKDFFDSVIKRGGRVMTTNEYLQL